jgi:aminopeptidase-like protein
VVTTFLAKWIASKPRRYTYRIVFIPETIGSITYLSRNLDHMKKNIVAGFNVTCAGDERAYSYLPSRSGSTLADKAALNLMRFHFSDFNRYSFLERGSDERQYCSPGVDLPIVSLMRSKYRTYPEYHTSLDNLDFVTPAGLQGGYMMLRDCIELLERNKVYRATCLCEPQLGKRGLYPTISTGESNPQVCEIMNVLAYADGSHDLIDISNVIQVPARRLYPVIEKLVDSGVLVEK